MQLEVGRTYRCRDGSAVTIIKDDGSSFAPFLGDNEGWYAPDGSFPTIPKGPSRLDITEEVREQS